MNMTVWCYTNTCRFYIKILVETVGNHTIRTQFFLFYGLGLPSVLLVSDMFAINMNVMFSASVQVSQYDEQFIQLFNFATTQLKQVCNNIST